jgi:hypothetical protein
VRVGFSVVSGWKRRLSVVVLRRIKNVRGGGKLEDIVGGWKSF